MTLKFGPKKKPAAQNEKTLRDEGDYHPSKHLVGSQILHHPNIATHRLRHVPERKSDEGALENGLEKAESSARRGIKCRIF